MIAVAPASAHTYICPSTISTLPQISKPNYGANVVVGAVVVVGTAVVQQSEEAVKKLGQLSVPHSRFPAQSSSPSQSPSKSPHGFELEQHDHVSSVDQLHPAKLGSGSKNQFENVTVNFGYRNFT